MVRNDQCSKENAIYASILSLKHLKVINTYPKYFQSTPSQCCSLELFHENLAPSPIFSLARQMIFLALSSSKEFLLQTDHVAKKFKFNVANDFIFNYKYTKIKQNNFISSQERASWLTCFVMQK